MQLWYTCMQTEREQRCSANYKWFLCSLWSYRSIVRDGSSLVLPAESVSSSGALNRKLVPQERSWRLCFLFYFYKVWETQEGLLLHKKVLYPNDLGCELHYHQKYFKDYFKNLDFKCDVPSQFLLVVLQLSKTNKHTYIYKHMSLMHKWMIMPADCFQIQEKVIDDWRIFLIFSAIKYFFVVRERHSESSEVKYYNHECAWVFEPMLGAVTDALGGSDHCKPTEESKEGKGEANAETECQCVSPLLARVTTCSHPASV